MGERASLGLKVGTGAALLLAGWALGGVAGLVRPDYGPPLAAAVVGLGGAIWAVRRIGLWGITAAAIGFVAAVGVGIEGHRARVASGPVTSVFGLQVSRDEGAVKVDRPLRHLPSLEGRGATRHRPGNSAPSTTLEYAVPLVAADAPEVVGFSCGRSRVDGTIAVPLELWDGSVSEACRLAVEDAERLSREAGRLSPFARRAPVRVFADEAAFRSGHALRFALALPLGLYAAWLVFLLAAARAAIPRAASPLDRS